MKPPAALIEKNVVLVGAGNAHLVFIRRFGMDPIRGIAVTLINEAPVVPYSAMVPGHIAGDYNWDEVTIDLVRLCASAGVRLVTGRVEAIDAARRQVRVAGRPPIVWDALSLGVGSVPACPAHLCDAESSLHLRPLAKLIGKVEQIEKRLQTSPGPFHLGVVGGGASGCELALAIHKRLSKSPGFRLTLLQGNARLLNEFPPGVTNRFEEAFRRRGIEWRVNARVTDESREGLLQVEGGDPVAVDAVLWATQATPTPLMRHSGLAVNGDGFLRVTTTLQSVGEPAIFGSGDCVAFEAYPTLPRNGVHAVREGRVLFDNVASFLHEKPLRPFRPQALCLALMNTADEEAVLSYGPLTLKGRWERRFKDRIDRRWVTMHTPGAMEDRRGKPGGSREVDEPLMRCGGCGSKISSDVLSSVLKRLDLPDDPRVLLGTRAGEDAAVHRVAPEQFGPEPSKLVEVQTVDYFKAFVDDPYLFGRIAALNAVSDLYAMNARPFSALAIATLPYARGPAQEAQLFELLSGAVETFKQLGVVLTGGHTTEGPELALGFAVTGFGEDGRLFQKANLRPGDALVLTKPLGTGALLAAWMRGQCRSEWFEPLIASMLQPNKAPGEIFASSGVTACTDVTGFGLAGHLLEMLDASRVSARLQATQVPLYAGFAEVTGQGIVSTLHGDNAKVECRVSGAAPAWLFDPQTGGGLLAGVRSESAPAVLDALHRAGIASSAVIGEVVPAGDGGPGIAMS